MAKRNHRLLSALLAAMLLSSSMVTANAATVGAADSGAGSLAKYYSTNGTGVGKEATITIDGDASDWDESMKIAQGAAWDVANHWKGGHENCVLDTYALYAAWDDSNLYIGWQMVNTTDTWAREGDGPLSDGGRVLDVPLIIALSTNPNNTAMTGKVTDGKGIWGVNIEFQTHVDTLLYMSGKPGLGTPGFFKAADSSGAVNYTDKNSCKTFAETGVEYKLATTNINSQIWGLDGTGSPEDVCDDSAEWVDFKTKSHDTKYDSFYECKIPFSALGISKSQLTSNGIGAMVVASRGESGLDCVPFDLCMLDNATGDYSSDPSTSAEKDDKDIITVPLASVGNGTITPAPIPTPEPQTDSEKPTPTPEPQTDSEEPLPTPGGGMTLVNASVSKGDTVTVTLGADGASNVLGISNQFNYESDKFQLVSAKALYSGVELNSSTAGTIQWNANLGDGSKGVTFSSDTPLVEIKLKALTDVSNSLIGANTLIDCYDYDFKTITGNPITGKAAVSGTTTSDTDSQTLSDPKEIKVTAKANAGDTVKVAFNGDLSKIEGVSSTFAYDSDAMKYVGCSKLDGVQVEVNQTTGIIRWNCVNVESTGKSDVVTFEFTARKNVNGVIGTNTIKEIYDSSEKDIDASNLTVKTTVNGTSSDSDTPVTDIDAAAKKVSVTAKKGDIVTLTFNAKGTKNAAGIMALVDYNTGALTYNNDAASYLGRISADKSNGRVAWSVLFDMDGTKKGVDLSSNPEVAVMTFTAQREISASEDALFYTLKEFYDIDDAAVADSNASAAATVAARGPRNVPVTAKQGNTVKVYCKGIDASKALGIVEELNYDTAALQYVGYDKEMGTFRKDFSTAGKIRWSSMFDANGTDLTDSTDIVVFTFKARKDISSSDKVLSYVVDEFYDVMTNDFDVSNTTMVFAASMEEDNDPPKNVDAPDDPTPAPASDTDSSNPSDPQTPDTDSQTPTTSDTEPIKVDSDTDTSGLKKITILYGDVDEDDRITSQDAIYVLRNSNNMKELEEIPTIAADVNDDGKITSADSLSVLRVSVNMKDSSLAGQRVEITINFK